MARGQASRSSLAAGSATPTTFQRKLAATARKQYDKYHLLRENDPVLAGQIEEYWKESGFDFPGVGIAWSAVFVSWCVKTAGATSSQFPFAKAHAKFVHRAIANAKTETGVFHGHDVSAYSPKVGDLLQNNRSGHRFDFAYAGKHDAYESHSAVVVEVGTDAKGRYAWTVGGNESDSVGLKEVRLDANGRVKNASGLYISVIETLL